MCNTKPFTGMPKSLPAKTFDVPSNPPVIKEEKLVEMNTFIGYVLYAIFLAHFFTAREKRRGKVNNFIVGTRHVFHGFDEKEKVELVSAQECDGANQYHHLSP